MSTSRAVQLSVAHTVLGIGIGSTIEACLPAFRDDASLAVQVFETLVQMGVNGVALAATSWLLGRDDPTGGIPFGMALFQAQGDLAQRVSLLSAAAKDRVAQRAQRTLARVSAA